MEKESKQTRKRRIDPKVDNVEIQINAPKAKFRPWTEESQAEEEQLNKILFGGSSSFLKSLEEAERETPVPDADSGVGDDENEDAEMAEESPAWHDDDDDGIEVGLALDIQGRKLPSGGINSRHNKYQSLLEYKFNTIIGMPTWAQIERLESRDPEIEEDKILQRCGFIRRPERPKLAQGVLEFKKVRDLNSDTYNEGQYINGLEFHPTSSVGLVAGYNGVASLFAVDGTRNYKLHSMQFENYPVFSAQFANFGSEIVFGSRHSHIFSYDLMAAKPIRVPLPSGVTQCKKFTINPDQEIIAVAGKWGEVHLLTARTKEKIITLKQDSEVTALAFNPSGDSLFAHSDSGEVTIFDVNMRRVKHKFVDEGCLQGTTIAISPSNQFFAAGSAQGIVNLYGMEDVLEKKTPQPRKTVSNLTTAITDLKFNHSSEILALSSIEIQNSVKMLHVASGTVFSNFPSFGTKLGHVNKMCFSPASGYFAMGNKRAIASMYRLKHYKHY